MAETKASVAADAAPSKHRFIAGVILFGLGLVSPAMIPVVSRLDLPSGWKTALSGLFLFGIPEVLWIAAAAVMGKAGFELLKRTLWSLAKRHALPERVSPTRHRIGLALFVLPIAFGWLGPYVALALPELGPHPLVVLVAGDVVFFASFFVLGGEFWDKLRALFATPGHMASKTK